MGEGQNKGRVLGYCRASTAKQEMSPESQKRIIKDAIARWSWPEPTWYVDPEQSGGLDILDRPAGRRLLADVKKGDTIVVAKLDRMSRNVKDLTTTVDLLIKKGVSLFLCDYGLVDFASPSGMCFVQMMSVFAEFERRIIGSRIREGLAYRKATGQVWSGACPLGFKKVTAMRGGQKVKLVVPDPKEREFMGQLVAWNDAGWSLDEIRSHLSYGIFNGQKGHPQFSKHTGQERTRDWTVNKVFRMIKAERALRLKEQVLTAVSEAQ